MMRSMFAAVSGLRGFQTMMDVVGNNIANVNTAGYKSSQVTFQEALSQMLRGPGTGLNPMEVGLGSKVASVDPIFTQGATQVTGRPTDVAIQGDGFFIVQNGEERLYTRAGGFGLDASGNLVAPNGYKVLGWGADPAGNIDTNADIAPVGIPAGQVIQPRATSSVEVGGNLSADAAIGDKVSTSIVVYDSLGNSHQALVEFTNAGPGAWTATATIDGTPVVLTPPALTFGPDGQLTSGPVLSISGFTPAGADPLAFDIDLQGTTKLVQFGGPSSAEAISQDGGAIGVLRGFAISDDGTVTGQFSNGQTRRLGAIAIASFANPAGMVRIGNSDFSASVNSGEALIGQPGTGSRGMLSAGSLEMSNVDLAQEFTNLIVAQRGFQANSRVISVSDEMLADLVNLKR